MILNTEKCLQDICITFFANSLVSSITQFFATYAKYVLFPLIYQLIYVYLLETLIYEYCMCIITFPPAATSNSSLVPTLAHSQIHVLLFFNCYCYPHIHM